MGARKSRRSGERYAPCLCAAQTGDGALATGGATFTSPLTRNPCKKQNSNRKQIDPALQNRFTDCMNLRFPIGLLLAGFVAAGCMHHSAHSQSGAAQTGDGTTPSPIITPDNSLTAKVVRYNSLARFVVLSFPVGQMPQAG